MNLELKNIQKLIPVIDPSRRYWFIRTEGGQLYDLFRSNNLVAIGFDKVKAEIKEQLVGEKDPKEALKKFIIKHYPEEKRPGLVASQICRFFFEVNKGDIVIIPSHSSEKLLFGEINNADIFSEHLYHKEQEKNYPFEKCRAVTWLKTVYRSELNPNLYSLFFSHQTISSGDEYASYIDNELEDCYIKGAQAHLVLNVKQERGINARSLFKCCLDLLDLTDDFLKENGLNEETKNIEVKTNLNSPGTVELIAYGISAVLVIGLLICMAGGNYEFKTKIIEGKLNTPGILKRIADFLEKKQRYKILEKLILDLKIVDPKNLKEALKKLISKTD